MNEDMEEVFQRKVEEKEDRMRRLERDENSRIDQDKRNVQEEKVKIHTSLCKTFLSIFLISR